MSNHRRMSSGISTIFPFDARASCTCFALTDLTVTVNSLPFLSLRVILQLVSREYIYYINFVKPKRSQMLWVQSFIEKGVCIRESPHRGQWQSPLQVCHQCRPMGSRYSRVVWRGVGMNANLCSWSFGYGRKAPCWNRLVRRATCKHR